MGESPLFICSGVFGNNHRCVRLHGSRSGQNSRFGGPCRRIPWVGRGGGGISRQSQASSLAHLYRKGRCQPSEACARKCWRRRRLKLPEHVSVDQLAGIKVEDCQVFSDDFGTVLDVEELVPGAEYTLEVSSPGLDRKLHGHDDYARFAGSLAKLRTVEPIHGNSHWQGRITNVTNETLDLDLSTIKKRKNKTEAVTGEKVTIAFSNILKANLIPEI